LGLSSVICWPIELARSTKMRRKYRLPGGCIV
jgi:hypothetical protein